MAKVWDLVEKNRFVVCGLLLGIFLTIYQVNCSPRTISPLDDKKVVDARGLELELKAWQSQQQLTNAKFELAAADMNDQLANQKKVDELIGKLAENSTNPTSWPGLLLSGGAIGAIIDNIRKRGVISGLKRNK